MVALVLPNNGINYGSRYNLTNDAHDDDDIYKDDDLMLNGEVKRTRVRSRVLAISLLHRRYGAREEG